MSDISKQFVAVLFTGQIRTLEKTIQNFKKYILDNNPNHTIHIYAVLECPEFDEEKKIQYTEKYNAIFEQYTDAHLKKIHWLYYQDEGLKKYKENASQILDINDNWKKYLVEESGSVTEYYQLNIGIGLIKKEVEEINKTTDSNFGYDYFMRTRCDIMLPNPITFDPMGENNETLIKRYQCIEKMYPNANKILLFCYFIQSLIYPFPFSLNERFMIDKDNSQTNDYLLELYLPDDIKDITEIFNPCSENIDPNEYTLLNFDFVHVFRQNLFYFSKFPLRELKYEYRRVPETKYLKGDKVDNTNESFYWFNSENQFITHVSEIEKKIVINSYTNLEVSSLYNYDETNYINIPPYLVFYICRN